MTRGKRCHTRCLLLAIAVASVLCVRLESHYDLWLFKSTQNVVESQRKSSLPPLHSFFVATDRSHHPSLGNIRNDMQKNKSHEQSLLRKRASTSTSSKSKISNIRRKLPGGYPDFGDPAMGGAVLFFIFLLFLLCCCRGMLCDLLACMCIYDICCDDGAVGGFDLMPL